MTDAAAADPLAGRIAEVFESGGDAGVRAAVGAVENLFAYRVQAGRLTLDDATGRIEAALERANLGATSLYAHPGAEEDFASYSVARNVKAAIKSLRDGSRLGFRSILGQDLVDAIDASLPDRPKKRRTVRRATETEPTNPAGEAAIASETPIAVIDAGDRGSVIHYAERIDWRLEYETRDGPVSRSWSVIDGHLSVVGRYEIDGDELFRVHEDKESFVSATTLRHRLDAAGKLVDHGKAPDALSLVLRHETRGAVIRGHSAAGVYADEVGKLSLDCAPFPRYAEQVATAEAVRKIVETKGSVDAVRAFLVDLPALWHAYEVLPIVGLSAISPFALVLRQAKEIVPHLFHVAHQHGLGKTTTATTYTESLFGIPVVAADSIRSSFRIAAAFDAVGCARTFDETEKVDERSWGPELKALAEQSIGAKRGTASLEMLTFWSRALGVLTGQRLPFETPSVLTRLIVVRYDETKLTERRTQEARRKLKAILARLRPIGWDLTAYAVTVYPTVASLVDRLAALGKEIDDAFDGEFEDGRRPAIWAAVYAGLEIWAGYAKTVGIDWSPPTIEQFVASVVVPNEVSTFNAAREPARAFAIWLDGYMVRNRLANGTIRGFGEIWRFDVVAGADGPILGRWITEPIVAEYNASAEPPMKAENLNEMGRQLADEFGLPSDLVLSDGGRAAKSVRFPVSDSVRKAVFVPVDIEAERKRAPGGPSTSKIGYTVTARTSTSEKSVTDPHADGYSDFTSEARHPVTVLPSSDLDPPSGVVATTTPSEILGESFIQLVAKGATDDQLRAVLRLGGLDDVAIEVHLARVRPRGGLDENWDRPGGM